MQSDDLYLALGDSTGVGVGAEDGGYPQRLLARLQAVRPSMRLLNLCQSGAATLDVLQSQVPDAERVRPALITLGVGINDVSQGEAEEAFTVNLEEIAVRLVRLAAPVVLQSLPDLAFAPAVRALLLDAPAFGLRPSPAKLAPPPAASFERRLEVANRHIEATAARHGFLFVDVFAQTRAALADHPEYFSADGFHPSDAGYDAWCEALWPPLRELFDQPLLSVQ
jgi:lysophospholipase L1-like esterase